MPNRDGIISIGFDYKKDLEKMIKDFEAEMNAVSSNTQLSKGMKKQFDNILAEMRDFKASMDKELANLGSGKVSQSSFKSFKQTVENKFKGIREDIDKLDLAVATLNNSMEILGKGVDLSKISNDFKNFEDYVTRTNSAVENLIHTLGEQGVSLFSFDNRNISDVQSTIRKIDNELKQLDKDTGAEFELFNEKQAQDELNRLSVQLTSTLELMENAKKQMETMDTSTEGFKKVRGEFALLQLKAASLNDTIEMLYEVTESKDMYIEMDDKSLSMYEKYTDELADNLETITSYAKNAKKELSSLLDTQKSPAIKVSSEMNPNSSELATVVTIETTSSELWKKLSPIMEDLQKTLNSNPVVAPVKLVVAPTSVSSAETGNLDVSKGYSKKYQKILAQTGEDAVVNLEGVYKKTFTSVMDTAVSYAKETIGKIQEIFDKNLIGVKFDISQEEIDKIQNFVLSNKDGKKVDISGQITKAKQEVEELNESIEKTAKLLDDTKSKGNIKFDGFDKFTQDVSKSIGKLEELQNILKALQNIEITLAKASGIASITELDNQWANVEKRILNATKLDGSFRKNASVSKIASEYQKYIDMGGANSIADIDKIKDNKDTLDAIISKAKEFAKQDLSNDSVKELSIELDGIIGKFDELIATVKTATNALYKIIKQTGVSELDKQWSFITNKFKSFADESDKINLSKQKKDVEELLVMYQRYVNMGGSHTPFDLTDNLETVAKLDQAYKKLNETKPIDNSSTIKSETESFRKVEQSVESLTKAIGDTKVQAINVEATAMEDAAEREILAINAIVDNLNMIVSKLKEIKGIKIPKIQVESVTSTSPVETNISSPIKDTFQGDTKTSAESSALVVKEEAKAMEQVAENAEKASKGKDKFAKANKKVKESADSSSKAVSEETSNLNKINTELDKYKKEFSSLSETPDADHRYASYEEQLTKLNNAIIELETHQNSLKNKDIINKEDIDEAQKLSNEIDELITKIKKIPQSKRGYKDIAASKMAEKIYSILEDNPRIAKKAEDEIRSYYNTLASGNPTRPLDEILDRVNRIIQGEREAGRAGKGFLDIFNTKVLYNAAGQLASYYLSLMDIVRYVKYGVGVIRELDTALTEMRKVSDETVSSLERFQDVSFDLADGVGTTAKQIQNSTADFMRIGEALNEASESAETANILKNVSEFENINEATDSLISMSQAYKELEKIEIVDTLNRLGNEYAISTDGLATALKDSASALKTAQNDFYEASALAVSANTVVQDPSKVGAGLRTISLRLTGTEAARKELEELGEDVSDFQVTTTSKLNQQIMDLTRTQDGLSVSLLDMNGNYRSTYEILLDIAKVWDKIAEEDLITGENRQNALLEMMAGKNRSNILASILESPDVLESAYNSAINATGSAQEELDKFLESIDGRMAKLENQAQEFWFKLIDSDAIKNGITLLTELLGLATDFVDTFGSLGSLATVGVGALSATKGLGLTNYVTHHSLRVPFYKVA